MFDDFFIRALVAGLGIALVTGPLGCFVIWRRLSFFAGTLAHSSLLGVTLAFSFDINISFSVLLISSALALILLKLQKSTKLPNDALLGLLAHSSLAIGLVVIGFLSYIRFDIMGLLFGDILAVNKMDLIDYDEKAFNEVKNIMYQSYGDTISFNTLLDTLKHFIAITGNNFPYPKFEKQVLTQNLHNFNEVDMIIVSPNEFLSAAQELKSIHQMDGLDVIVVTTSLH